MWRFLFDTPPLSIFICPVCLHMIARLCAWTYMWISAYACVCACLPAILYVCLCVFYFLDWSVGALLFSELVTYFKASNWHDSVPTALRVTRGFIKACIWNSRKTLSRSRQIKQGCSLLEYYKVTDVCRGISDHLAERSHKSKHRFDELQRTCHYLFASQWNIT